jgi:hypothetical protein
MKDSFGYVYLIGSHTYKWYKIGKTNKPVVRLQDLGILLPFKIELMAMWKSWNASVESHLHTLYANQRINGEWFYFTRKQLLKVISEPVWNATLLFPAEFADASELTRFTNLERDCPEGKIVRVKISGKPPDDPYIVAEYILSRKLRQAFRDYPDCITGKTLVP